MNRHDLVQAKARDIASNIHADPVARDRLADDLIDLIGQMLDGVGKAVAIEGESAMNEPFYEDSNEEPEEHAERYDEYEADQSRAMNRYLIGERIQDATRAMVKDCQNPEVNLERWRKTDPGTPCECGHNPSVHKDGACTGEQYNKHACKGGPCPGFRVQQPTGGWVHEDRRPEGLKLAAIDVARRDPFRADNPVLPRRDPGATLRCNCCAGPCRNGWPAPGPERCCFPLGDVCPNHC